MSETKDGIKDWETIVKSWKASGLSKVKYCKEQKLSVHSLKYYCYKQEKEEGKFYPVKIQIQDCAELVYPNGVKLRLNSEIDIKILKKLGEVYGC